MMHRLALISTALFIFACSGPQTTEEEATATPADCKPVECELACKNGFATNDAGCEVCSCREEPRASEPGEDPPPPEGGDCEPASTMCEQPCEHGYVQDALGCETCECIEPAMQERPQDCEPVMCDLWCGDKGFAVDERGCPVCGCAE